MSQPATQLTLEQLQALQTLAFALKGAGASPPVQPASVDYVPSIADFAHNKFYIPPTVPRGKPATIKLLTHQQIILNLQLNPIDCLPLELLPPSGHFQTIVYSSIKKSGKTTVASLVARHTAENFGPYSEVFCMANDLEQARGRIYQGAVNSIELDPNYDPGKRVLRNPQSLSNPNNIDPITWRIIERQATHVPTRSIMRAVSMDYKGEAGSNPTATFWSELWGFQSEAARRMWQELTPVPTRPQSFRYVETYAGFTGESVLLQELWSLATDKAQGAIQLTLDMVPDWPWKDQPIPLYVNPLAGVIAYIDQGPQARRMPWQTPDYYSVQARSLSPAAFDRLHFNYWTDPATEFIPLQWWRDCYDPTLPLNPPPDSPNVLGADASVTGDCTALVRVGRHPNYPNRVALYNAHEWRPSKNAPMNYSTTIEPLIREYCAQSNIVQTAYDPYQLHDLMTRLSQEGICWTKPFNQMGDRLKADKQLQDIIRDRRIVHNMPPGSPIERHILGASGKSVPLDNTKMRIVKRATDSNIDLVVALSMAASECLRLNLV